MSFPPPAALLRQLWGLLGVAQLCPLSQFASADFAPADK